MTLCVSPLGTACAPALKDMGTGHRVLGKGLLGCTDPLGSLWDHSPCWDSHLGQDMPALALGCWPGPTPQDPVGREEGVRVPVLGRDSSALPCPALPWLLLS